VPEGGAAIAQDWMAVDGGSERVTVEFSKLMPTATVYTSFFNSSLYGTEIAPDRVRPWTFQRLVGPTPRFRMFLPFYPVHFGGLDLRSYRLVVSSAVAFSHAVRTAPSAFHVAYVYTPLRYAWDLDTYLAGSSFTRLSRLGAQALRAWLRRWDLQAAKRPDTLVAISNAVRDRIRQRWDRDAEVIYPPVSIDEVEVSSRDDGYLLVAARMLAYRRIDIAVAAATALGRELVVVGDGPERGRLEAMAGPTVRFLGRVSRPSLLEAFANCHAYLVPGIEDFGIAPVEAMAAGKPVVGLGMGGAAETVVDGITGVLVADQTVDALVAGIERLDLMTFDRAAIRRQAERFDRGEFHRQWAALLAREGVDPALYDLDAALRS
jgi:glycosyltransferase involved in cell wall biosynthesis